MNPIIARWSSRAWSLLAATWLAATYAWLVADKMTAGEWGGTVAGCIAAWFGWDGFKNWRAKNEE